MTSLVISSWNIQGLNASAFGSKVDDPDFKQGLYETDIQILLETWTRAQDEPSVPTGYREFSVPAQKDKNIKQGRCSGGILVWYKEELHGNISAIKKGESHIWLRISSSILTSQSDIYLCAAYIAPAESPYFRPDTYEILQNEAIHFQSLGQVLICGDLNARTGREKDYTSSDGNTYILGHANYDQESIQNQRNSYDSTTNKNGRKLLNVCRSLGLYILNGRTKGDSLGRYTFSSHVGSSVVDYAITDMNPTLINGFTVTPQTHLSDHNQLLLYIKSSSKPSPKLHRASLRNLPPSFKWSKQSTTKYREVTDRPDIKKQLENFQNNTYEISPPGVNQAAKDFHKILHTIAETAQLRKINYKKPSNKQSNKWFDKECKALRNTLRTVSNNKHRDPDNADLRIAHSTLQKKYKQTLKKKKQDLISKNLQQLEEALQENSFWETWKNIGSAPRKNNLHIQNGDIWLNYFKDLYKNIPEEALTVEQKDIIKRLNDMEEKIKDFQNPLDVPITPQEIGEKIQNLQTKKSSGMDGILPEMIKHGSPEVHAAMCKLFNLVLSAGYYPTVWNQGLITPIHKSGDQYDPSNYRGICVSSTLGKLFNSILNKRILNFLTQHNVLSRSQAGFMPNHRTTDHIYTLHSLIKNHVHHTKHGKIFACFVDFKKAFDSVWHPGLFLKLLESGIGGKTYDVIKSSYTENSCSVKVNGKRTEHFRQARGVRQGCSLSPTLFNIYINGLAAALESSPAPGLTLHDTEVKFLLYADDLLLLSPTEKGLQDSLEVLEKYSATWALPINSGKTKTMVFQKKNTKQTKSPSFTINNCTVDETNSYTYLGLDITQSGSFKPAIEALKDKACRAYYAIRRRLYHLKPPVRVWLRIFDSVIAPILLYGSEVWGPVTYPDQSKWDPSPTEIFHLEFCKHLLQVRRSSSNSACRSELGRFPLLLAVQKRALSYWDHLQNSSPNSYHHKALLDSKNQSKPCGLQQFINTLSPQNSQQCGLPKSQIKTIMENSKEQHVGDWRQAITNSKKLLIYQSLQRDFKLATYLRCYRTPKTGRQ